MAQTDRNNATTNPPSPPPQLQEAVDAAIAAQQAAEVAQAAAEAAAAIVNPSNYVPKTGGTFTGAISVPADPYNRSTWNGVNEVPTKNDVSDKFEASDKRFTTAGSSPTFTVDSLSLFGNTYATNERLKVIFNAGVSSGASTLNRDGLGAKSIKQFDSTGAKVNPVIIAGQFYEVEYDGTDYLLLSATTPVYTSVLDLPGGQIKFPATQNPSTDANTLDDYEEGSWTVALSDGAYTGGSGRYIKIGKLVTLWFTISVSTQTNANPVRISTNPFVQLMSMETGGGILTTETTAVRLASTSTGIYPRTAANADISVTTFSGDTLSGFVSFQNNV